APCHDPGAADGEPGRGEHGGGKADELDLGRGQWAGHGLPVGRGQEEAHGMECTRGPARSTPEPAWPTRRRLRSTSRVWLATGEIRPAHCRSHRASEGAR